MTAAVRAVGPWYNSVPFIKEEIILFCFRPIVIAPSLWTTTMTVIIVVHEIFKMHCPFHITHELGKMTQIPLGTCPEMIRIEKFHTKTVSILSFLMFEKCRCCENYPYGDTAVTSPPKSSFPVVHYVDYWINTSIILSLPPSSLYFIFIYFVENIRQWSANASTWT